MSTALTILLVMIASGPVDERTRAPEAEDPSTPAIARAAREALGGDTKVVLRVLPTLPSAAEAVALGDELHVDAVVEVTWTAPDHLRTIIRVERSTSGRWISRAIDFKAIDDPVERSRTVGLAIASMLPESQASAEGPAPLEKRRTTAVPSVKRGPRAAEKHEPIEFPPEAAGRPVRHASSLSGVGTAAFGVGDHAGAVGVALDFRHGLGPALSFRVSAGGRVGQDPPAGVTTRFFHNGAGLAWSAWTTENGRGSLGLRLDATLLLAQFAHSSPDGATANRYKLVPGGDLLIEAGYFFTRGVAIVAGGGGEAVFGQTDVFVGGRRAATLGPLHPALELGLRLGF